jgi:membrane-associated phospholipid phosphatase
MNDVFQQFAHHFALQSSFWTSLTVFCASTLLFVLIAGGVVIGMINLRRITWMTVARMIVAVLVAGTLTLLIKHLVNDPRPFMVEHYKPLAHASSDNGFPSDHTLVAALLVAWTWLIDRRWTAPFVVGLLAVLLGRLGIGAHHTLDVLASVVFAALGLLAALLVGWPQRWHERIFSSRT